MKLIGTADLQIGDESMGCIFGEFIPNDVYFKDIQKSVWTFWRNKKPDYKKWRSLRFNVQLENGYFLYSCGGYTFDDFPESVDEPKRIDIAGVDRHVIEDYFLQAQPRTFLEKPWDDIGIEQKIAFENELFKELGIIDKPVFNFMNFKKNNHILMDFELSALGHDQRNDDVLFVTRKEGFAKQFAVVHLTWKKKKELKGYPNTKFYDDFNDFKLSRMYKDRADWE